VTARHRKAALALLDPDDEIVKIDHGPSTRRIETIARKLAELEYKTRMITITERQIVGNTDRWIEISNTSPSGKTLFVCRSCGRQSPAPDKVCSGTVKLWNGEFRACADWEPAPIPPNGRIRVEAPGLTRAIELVEARLEYTPPFDGAYAFGKKILNQLREELGGKEPPESKGQSDESKRRKRRASTR